MDALPTLAELGAWVGRQGQQLALTAFLFGLYALIDRISRPRIEEGVDRSRLKPGAGDQALRVVRIVGLSLLTAGLIIVWGIDIGALLVLSTTIITLTGVALFASWSLLSNVTAYFVILFNPSFRRGNFVRVIDLDNYIEGYISEITLFHTRLITENRESVSYPNTLLLMRPCLVNPRTRLDPVGKIGARAPGDTQAQADNGPSATVSETKGPTSAG